MRFGGEVDHYVRMFLCKHSVYKLPVSDISSVKHETLVFERFFKRLEIAGICESVYADYSVLRVFIKLIIYEV